MNAAEAKEYLKGGPDRFASQAFALDWIVYFKDGVFLAKNLPTGATWKSIDLKNNRGIWFKCTSTGQPLQIELDECV